MEASERGDKLGGEESDEYGSGRPRCLLSPPASSQASSHQLTESPLTLASRAHRLPRPRPSTWSSPWRRRPGCVHRRVRGLSSQRRLAGIRGMLRKERRKEGKKMARIPYRLRSRAGRRRQQGRQRWHRRLNQVYFSD